MHMIRLRREFVFNSDAECAIQFHDYSEAIVVSMVILEFQATVCASCLRYGMIDIEADGVGSGDINADAEDPAYGT
ncbi:Cysteine-Rich Secretory Protein Lccl Domain-Containing 1 [Manis pentadactyla]|nr:Cysteine-Rich Secretory Protein Lccl Domain-Containing 1 [Manis pentadactyla]